MASEEEDVSGDNEVEESESVHTPREVLLTRSSKGFGFNIRGQVSEGGKLRPIGGELYAPLQYISAVVEGGPAAEASIKPGDRLTEVNGISVEGADHQKVVDLIKSSGNSVRLTVLSVTSDEASRLEQDSHTQAQDSFDMRSVPVQIPSFDKKTGQDGKEFVVRFDQYCVRMCCVRVCHLFRFVVH
jgi:sorting nexin-27